MNRRTFVQTLATAASFSSAAGALASPVPARTIQPWFHRAAMGLFIHWGPCSVAEVEISWTMYKNMEGPHPYWPPEKYNALADRFDPQHYDPDKWLEAAARAGFKYAVFVTRHHDGYTMWPSQYGAFGTRHQMKGRDLVRPFVEACWKHGLKPGFYYSPTDWNFCPQGWPYRGWPRRDPTFLYTDPPKAAGTPRFIDMKQEEFDKYFPVFFNHMKGQITELMTNYGKIDLLWWDGLDWPGGFDIRGLELENHVRKLQPEIVVNDRYGGTRSAKSLGDYNTDYEARDPDKRPAGAWEQCEPICGGWSYRGEKALCQAAPHLIERLARTRAWGGNYLPNFGPRADGTMPPDFYTVCDGMAAWMKHSAVSVYDVEAGAFPQRCNCPVTVKGGTWYVHFIEYRRRVGVLKGVGAPKSAVLLRTGKAVAWRKEGDDIWLFPEKTDFTAVDDVVAVTWDS
jgi:alpha-L-fucosidase